MISKEPEKIELGPEGARRSYWLKPPALYERIAWRRAIAANGGKQNGPLALLDMLAHGVVDLMAGEDAEIVDALLAKIDRQRAAVDAWLSSLRSGATEDEQKQLAAVCEEGARDLTVIEQEVSANWPPYAAAVGDDAAYWQIAGIEAARLFLVKWEGLSTPLKRTKVAGVADDCLAEIPEHDLPLLGLFAQRLSSIGAPERKNSNSPPLSSSGGEISTSLNGATNGASPSSASQPSAAQSLN